MQKLYIPSQRIVTALKVAAQSYIHQFMQAGIVINIVITRNTVMGK